MINRSLNILWPIDYSSMTSINHWCNWLLIDDPSITHRLLYCARKTLFVLSCTIFYSFVILLSVLHPVFLVSEVPVDDIDMQSANHKYRWFSIVQFAKPNNLDRAAVKVWFNRNGKFEILESLLKLNFHVLLKVAPRVITNIVLTERELENET